MPKSIETSSEFDFSSETNTNQPPLQLSNASASSHGVGGGGGVGGKEQQQQQQQHHDQPHQSNLVASNSSSSSTKRYRHQNYSKNIYIGTKNAEKWEKVRSVLSFKNDVEFVGYLLKLAELDLSDNNG